MTLAAYPLIPRPVMHWPVTGPAAQDVDRDLTQTGAAQPSVERLQRKLRAPAEQTLELTKQALVGFELGLRSGHKLTQEGQPLLRCRDLWASMSACRASSCSSSGAMSPSSTGSGVAMKRSYERSRTHRVRADGASPLRAVRLQPLAFPSDSCATVETARYAHAAEDHQVPANRPSGHCPN
jgi:hypothetical protein